MSSIPYSRYLIYPVPWYSFLIVVGAILAIFLACREERFLHLPKDTVIDLSLLVLPFGILGARAYYVLFSWEQFSGDLFSVLRIWEGGLAIYGGVIAGFIVLLFFSKKRGLSALLLCDLIAPGLVLAQSIGRWGNWFNMEAYGLPVTNQAFFFFPFAVQIPADGNSWHLATFFYESVWDFAIFLFLILARHRYLRRQGDVFFFYLFLYASGRLFIEEMRMDSLYASSSIRISQLLSVLLCIFILIRYLNLSRKNGVRPPVHRLILLSVSLTFSVIILVYSCSGLFLSSLPAENKILVLFLYAIIMICSLFSFYPREVKDANIKS